MKKLSILFLVSIVVILASCTNPHSNDNFNIKLTITGTNGDSVFLRQRVDGEMITYDSAVLKDNKAQLWGHVNLPEFFYIAFNDNKSYFTIFVSPGDITVAGDYDDLQNVTITGSNAEDEYKEFIAATNDFDQQMAEMGQQYGQARQMGDTAKMAQIEREYSDADAMKTSFITNYAFEHPNSVVSAFEIMGTSYQYDLIMLDSIVSAFDPSISESFYVKKLQDYVNTLKRVQVGQPFVDFTLNNPDGVPTSLSSVVGKNYVLVDFWASWCSPCRAENPNVVAAYQKYHDKGFDVFGVSFDKSKEGWIKAVADDHLDWTQVSDLKYWNSEAGKLYGIQSIPQNILISPEGIIIEKNLRGQDLQDKLEELFN
ncbi:MAG: TlpA disulfide reductase family protein [Bacteroidales bacterium]|jgi:peroxiredoxin